MNPPCRNLKRLDTCTAISTLLLILGMAAARAQEPTEREVRRSEVATRLTAVLTYLKERQDKEELQMLHHNAEFSQMRELVTSSLKDTNTIFSTRMDYSKLFLRTVDYDREAFETYANAVREGGLSRSRSSIASLIADAAMDLALKAKLAMSKNRDCVNTNVHTLDGSGNEVQGCDVWYVPFLKDDFQHRERFDRRSSPTTQCIVSGKWSMWSEKDGKTGDRVPFHSGDTGDDLRDIDIPAPK